MPTFKFQTVQESGRDRVHGGAWWTQAEEVAAQVSRVNHQWSQGWNRGDSIYKSINL